MEHKKENQKNQSRSFSSFNNENSSQPISQRYVDNRPEMQSAAQLYAAIRQNTINNRPSYISPPKPTAQRQAHPYLRNQNTSSIQRKEVDNGDFHIQMARDEMAKPAITHGFTVPPVSEDEEVFQMKQDKTNSTIQFYGKEGNDQNKNVYDIEQRGNDNELNTLGTSYYSGTDMPAEYSLNDTIETQENENKVLERKYTSGLPTPYGALINHYSRDTINENKLKQQEQTLDRPHSMKVSLSKIATKRTNDEAAFVSSIGHMGTDEAKIKGDKSKDLSYDGGHLVGAAMFSELEDKAFNIAPQQSKLNRAAYNQGIENVVRKAQGKGHIEELEYEVRLIYNKSTYKVSQGDLENRGIIKQDSTKNEDHHKEIYIPSRVPEYWSAKAKIKLQEDLGADVYNQKKGALIKNENKYRKNNNIGGEDENQYEGTNEERNELFNAYKATSLDNEEMNIPNHANLNEEEAKPPHENSKEKQQYNYFVYDLKTTEDTSTKTITLEHSSKQRVPETRANLNVGEDLKTNSYADLQKITKHAINQNLVSLESVEVMTQNRLTKQGITNFASLKGNQIGRINAFLNTLDLKNINEHKDGDELLNNFKESILDKDKIINNQTLNMLNVRVLSSLRDEYEGDVAKARGYSDNPSVNDTGNWTAFQDEYKTFLINNYQKNQTYNLKSIKNLIVNYLDDNHKDLSNLQPQSNLNNIYNNIDTALDSYNDDELAVLAQYEIDFIKLFDTFKANLHLWEKFFQNYKAFDELPDILEENMNKIPEIANVKKDAIKETDEFVTKQIGSLLKKYMEKCKHINSLGDKNVFKSVFEETNNKPKKKDYPKNYSDMRPQYDKDQRKHQKGYKEWHRGLERTLFEQNSKDAILNTLIASNKSWEEINFMENTYSDLLVTVLETGHCKPPNMNIQPPNLRSRSRSRSEDKKDRGRGD